jgi:tetratricopeptide (TPR) repeat protein
MRMMVRSIAALGSLVCSVAPGWADTPPAPVPAPTSPAPSPAGGPTDLPTTVTDADLAKAARTDDRPWARGVSESQQKLALARFAEANAQLRDSLFVLAVASYRSALEAWDHPAIHYNLALALVNLDQPVEMHEELVKAMAYGEAPLDADKYERAVGYKTLVEKQIASVEYSIDIAGAVVTFDGTEVLTGPGTWSARVRAGNHAVAARAPGYLPTQLEMKLGGGEQVRLNLRLYTDAEVTRYKRRYPTWAPWAVAAGGVVLGGVGALLHRTALAGYDDYDAAIDACAAADPSGGCSMPAPEVRAERRSADVKQALAFTGYALGAAALATGITLIVLNRPSAYRIDPEARGPRGLEVAPAVTPTSALLTARMAF